MVRNLADLLAVAGRRFGAREAVVAPDRTVSFSELDDLASRVASKLLAEGIGSGDVVTLWFDNGWRWMAAYYGALRAGAVVNPVNALLTSAEVDYIVRDCRARLIIGAAERIHTLTPGVRTVDDAAGLDAMLTPRACTERLPATDIGSSSLASICYTSGTTGQPKGAMLTHQAVLMNTLMTSLMHGRGAGDVVVSALPCPHVYGNVVMNSAIACGMTLVLFSRFDEEAVLDAIVRYRATLFEGVPTMYMRLLNHVALERAELSSLQRCTVGGQTMPVTTMQEVERRFGCRLLELWGMTELAGLGTTHPWNGPSRLGSIGVPLPFYEARVVHVEDTNRVMPEGEVGELLIRGPSVMNGYLGNDVATREAMEPDGWLHTGDLVHRDREGCYYVVDRKKEMILTAGYSVYPAELERVIAGHPAVAMVAVGRIPDATRGEVAKAYVVLRSGAAATAEQIVEYCRGQLAAYKLPRQVQFVADLPRTSTGKILRRELYRLDAPAGARVSDSRIHGEAS